MIKRYKWVCDNGDWEFEFPEFFKPAITTKPCPRCGSIARLKEVGEVPLIREARQCGGHTIPVHLL